MRVMRIKHKPFYRRKYRNELIEEVTGMGIRAFQAMVRRRGMSVGDGIFHAMSRARNKTEGSHS